MKLEQSLMLAVAGMKAQGTRMRVIAENIANAESLGETPGADPYRRKLVTFKNVLDRTMGAETVSVARVRPDMSDFRLTYDPEHPAADENGYVRMPNVNTSGVPARPSNGTGVRASNAKLTHGFSTPGQGVASEHVS